MDWSTPADRLASVDPVAKPARNWVWYVDRTVKTCAGIAIVSALLAWLL